MLLKKSSSKAAEWGVVGLAAAATERGEEERGGDELRTGRIAAKEGAELELQ